MNLSDIPPVVIGFKGDDATWRHMRRQHLEHKEAGLEFEELTVGQFIPNVHCDGCRRVRAFLEDVAAVSRKHGYCISHEDDHGAFIVSRYDGRIMDWLMSADPEWKRPE